MDTSTELKNDRFQLVDLVVDKILAIIEHPREKEIITRRFGLGTKKETLEQIGERLDITRERVRQLEKAALIRLKIAAEKGKIDHLSEIEKILIRNLAEAGRIDRTKNIVRKILGEDKNEKYTTNFIFIAEVSSKLVLLSENDKYHSSIANAEYGDERKIKKSIDEIVNIIKKQKSPVTLEYLDDQLDYEHPSQINAIASISKLLATLNGLWGLEKWPSVNPKNIRDKIFVILEENKNPMHFSKIAEQIRESDFSRNEVTTQSIHN